MEYVKGSVPNRVNFKVLLTRFENLPYDLNIFFVKGLRAILADIPQMIVAFLDAINQLDKLNDSFFWDIAHLVFMRGAFGLAFSCWPIFPRQYLLELAHQLGHVHVWVEHLLQIDLDQLFERLNDFILAIKLHQALEIALLHVSRLKRLVDSLLQYVTICPIE